MGVGWTVADAAITMLFNLASDVIKAREERKKLEKMGKIFLKALKEHEKTVRLAIKAHVTETLRIIKALEIVIKEADGDEIRLEAAKQLAEFGGKALLELEKQSREALRSIPAPVSRKTMPALKLPEEEE